MEPVAVEDLAARLAHLERAHRRLKAVLALALLLGAGGVLLGATCGPGPVEATRFVLRDGQGRERGVLEMAESGGPQLLLIGPEGDLPVALFAAPGGVRGITLSEGEAVRAGLTATPGGAAALALESDGRASGGAITLGGSGAAMVRTWGAGGDCSLASPADHPARVEVRDVGGELTGRVPPSNEPFGHPGRTRPVRVEVSGGGPGHAGPRPGL